MHSSVKTMLLSELRCKEVICLSSGSRLGYVNDLELDVCCGKVLALILPGPKKFKGFLACGRYRVPWAEIASIGSDLILVNSCQEIGFEGKKEK